jgi:D-serine deaminase-like pyridoxal phosphate-dependent protein
MFSPLNHGNPKLPGNKLDFFLTAQVLHPPKLRRLFELASAHEETTLISVMVDAVSNLETLAELSASHKTNLGVFVEVYVEQSERKRGAARAISTTCAAASQQSFWCHLTLALLSRAATWARTAPGCPSPTTP